MLDTAVTSGTLIGPMEINHVLVEAAEAEEASSVVTMYVHVCYSYQVHSTISSLRRRKEYSSPKLKTCLTRR